ncbi:MAG: MFS transporter [Spirochaetaceae bacterium]|nr:MFS transporter [Spirochaetaceae bacterium]
MIKGLSRKALILYAVCNFGWSLAFYNVNNVLNYFYFPNIVNGGSMFPLFIPPKGMLFGLTFLGLIIAFGRIIDAITDPIIANISDRSKHRWGKRRFFMLAGSFPSALFGFLAFCPPLLKTGLFNGFYLLLILLFYYISLTMYVVPCSALVGELSETKTERLNLSTASSVGWALGFGSGSTIYALQSAIEKAGYSPVKAFQTAIFVLAVVSFITMFVPAYFIRENNNKRSLGISVFASLREAIHNRNLCLFLISELAYWFALTFIQTGISYYVVSLLGLDKSFATICMVLMLLVSFVFYVPINLFARRIGKKNTILGGYTVLGLTFILIFLLGRVGIMPEIQAVIVALVTAVPVGIFGILPFAIIGDLAEKDGKDTGNYKIGVFYALRGIFMKSGTSLAGLLFPTVIVLGSGEINRFGIRMTGLFGLIFCLIGFVFMIRYKEV